MKPTRAIAFYLPQYHPVAINDNFWGKGFTEWTNVTKARPIFRGHQQPKLPSELGFYDLRVSETRIAQADLAREAGIEGFCYWHYWFGNGKRALERVFEEVVQTGEPDFPFCLAWANQTWTGHWHGLDSEVIVEQIYGGEKDFTNHFYSMLSAFKDARYIRVYDRLLFLIFEPKKLPKGFLKLWRELARHEGVGDFHFVGLGLDEFDAQALGYDGYITHALNQMEWRSIQRKITDKIFRRGCITMDYRDYMEINNSWSLSELEYPIVTPNWDNTPRSGKRSKILLNSHPDLFEISVSKTAEKMQARPVEERLLFVKSWNEWAEGNYLEPDQNYGRGWINAMRAGLEPQ